MPKKIIKDIKKSIKKDIEKKEEKPKLVKKDLQKLKKFEANQKQIAKKAIEAVKTKKIVPKQSQSQLRLRFDIKDEIKKARIYLSLKSDKFLIEKLVAALKKIKAQLQKDHAPTAETARRSALKALIVVNIVDEILKERKKHTQEKFFYKTAGHEIKRFFTVFHKLTKELHKESQKKK